MPKGCEVGLDAARAGTPGWGARPRRRVVVRSAARLHVRLHLAELVRVRLGVVPAEEQLAALGEYGSDLCRRAATVAGSAHRAAWRSPSVRRLTGVRHR